MRKNQKPTPEKFCEYCSKQLARKRLKNGELMSLLHFNRMKYCNRECMSKAFSINQIKTEGIAIRTSRAKAQYLIPKGSCEICGKENALDVHHKDENPLNNSLENLQRLCRSCHIKI